MRYIQVLFLVCLFLTGIQAQPLQFIDKADSTTFNAVDLVGNNKGGWFTLSQTKDSNFQITVFDHCGKVDACTKLNIQASLKLSTPQLAYIGQDKYLIAGTIENSTSSGIILFYYENGVISQAKVIGAANNTRNYNPVLSVYKDDKILLGFNYVSGSFGSSRVVLLDKQLNVRWSKHIQQESHIRWVKMINDTEFVVGDIFNIMKYDTTGKNIWSKYFVDYFMMYNSVLVKDSNIIFAMDYVNPIFDTSTILKPRYKKVICLNFAGKLIWQSDRIRSLRNVNLNQEFNSRLLFNSQKNVILNTVDTVDGDPKTAIFAHTLNDSGRIVNSKYWSSQHLISDYKSALLDDGNFAVVANHVDSSKNPLAFLNIKTSMQYEACETKSFINKQIHNIIMDSLILVNLPDSALTIQTPQFSIIEDSMKLFRVCEVFDLKDGEVPTPLCKGDSIFLAGVIIPNATYVWSNGSMQSGTYVKEAGNYSLQISYCGKTVTITYKVFYISYANEVIAIEECEYPRKLDANRGPGASYKWATGDSTDFLNITGPGTYTVTVTKCQSPFTLTFNVSLKQFKDEVINYTICNYPFTLYGYQGPGITAVRYLWDDGSTNGARAITGPGTYVVTNTYCQSTFKTTFNVSLDIRSNQTVEIKDSCSNFPILITALIDNGDSYKWNTGETTSVIAVPKPGTYTVEIKYCMNTYTNTFIVKDLSDFLVFPNVFPPNSDIKENQIFKPFVKDSASTLTDYNLEIYNRWGQKVFTSNQVNLGWDGEFKGAPAPIDTYTYFATVKATDCGAVKVYRGGVTLVR
ncbi:MAG: gliding motility-associated C-terminal domain-containing protein [Saprospiraceae bacterium]|nr:gliding motility-associated C-terminal domain-containing protein [Saprospiraceae bacterium]MBK9727532.1 gliding motility-associated C-terminal domain-containing protein [Saprospiraceae bacterium]